VISSHTKACDTPDSLVHSKNCMCAYNRKIPDTSDAHIIQWKNKHICYCCIRKTTGSFLKFIKILLLLNNSKFLRSQCNSDASDTITD